VRLPAFVAAELENVPRFSVTYLFWIDIGEIETTRTRPNPSRHASDQGDRGTGILASRKDWRRSVLALRIEVWSRVLPLTTVAAQCKIDKTWLVVRDQLGTYRIEMLFAFVLRVTDSGVESATSRFNRNYSKT